MTSYFPFNPSTSRAVQFQPTLTDLAGNVAQYTATVTWALQGARWYFNLFQLNQTLVLSRPLIATPAARNIQSLAWLNGIVTAIMAAPHGWSRNRSLPLTIAGCAPAAYNGFVMAFITDFAALSWPLTASPGPTQGVGTASYGVNLVGGYFASMVLFRNNQFEVSP